MKKLLLGCLIFITACQAAAPTLPEGSMPITATQTLPQPATPAEAIIPTPSFTPFFFTEEFNTDMSAWISIQTGGETNPTVALENDMLRVDISSPHTWYYAIHTLHEYQNVSVRAKFTGTPSGSMGLICRYSKNGWYEFNLASDGTYSILFGQLLGEGIAQYTPVATGESQYLQAGILNYEIGLTCRENNLLLYINEILLRKMDVSRYALVEGMIGITASSFDQTPMTASFEWVKVGND